MPSLIDLRYEEPLEVPDENSDDSQVAAENSSLTPIFHHFVGLVAADGQVRVCPVANSLHLGKEVGQVN